MFGEKYRLSSCRKHNFNRHNFDYDKWTTIDMSPINLNQLDFRRNVQNRKPRINVIQQNPGFQKSTRGFLVLYKRRKITTESRAISRIIINRTITFTKKKKHNFFSFFINKFVCEWNVHVCVQFTAIILNLAMYCDFQLKQIESCFR